MEPTPIASILRGEHTDREVRVRGWVYRQRSSGGIAFVVVRDGDATIQATVKQDEVDEEAFQAAVDVQVEASVVVEGTVAKDDRAPGGFELKVSDLEVVGESHRFPIQEEQSAELQLDRRHLFLRSTEMNRVLKVKAKALSAMREWFSEQGFVEVHPPILTGTQVEGGATLFEVDYFGDRAYLSQSVQLYLEALIFGLEKVWSLTPSFRAEKSRTSRHLAEYWHLEAEMAWMDHGDNLEVQEQLVAHCLDRLAHGAADLLRDLDQDPKELAAVEAPFPRITYREAVDRLASEGFDIAFGDGFGAPEERALTEEMEQPLFVTHYPSEGSAFYMKRDPDDPEVNRNADLLGPGGYGEIIGGSERETDVDILVDRLEAEGEDVEDYDWYLDLRRYGSVPHSGFGLGTERLIRWVCGLDHIRDAIPFPRTVNRVYP